MRLEQDPIHRHKDVLAHTIAVVAKTRPELKVRLAALLHDVGKPTTRGFGPQRRDVPPPRGRRRAHGAASACSRCATRTRSSTTSPSSSSCTCASTRTGWAGPTARCAATCATPAPARRAERADALRLHHAQRAEGRRRSAAAWTSSKRASPSCGSRRSSTRSGRRSTATRSCRSSACSPGPIVGEALRLPAGDPPRRGRDRPSDEAYARARRRGRASAGIEPADDARRLDRSACYTYRSDRASRSDRPRQCRGRDRRSGSRSARVRLEQCVDAVAGAVQRREPIVRGSSWLRSSPARGHGDPGSK